MSLFSARDGDGVDDSPRDEEDEEVSLSVNDSDDWEADGVTASDVENDLRVLMIDSDEVDVPSSLLTDSD